MAKLPARERQGRPVKEPAGPLAGIEPRITEASASSMPIAWQDAIMAFLRSVLSL